MQALLNSRMATLCCFAASKIVVGFRIYAQRVRPMALIIGASIPHQHCRQVRTIFLKRSGELKIRASLMCLNLSSTQSCTHHFRRGGPGVSLALTKDFKTFERYGVIMQPEDKDAALLPRRMNGLWALIHRPVTTLGAHMWLSYSPDLRHWGGHKIMLEARRGGWWDANKIGLSSPPIETPVGWLTIYHGVRQTASGSIYRLGLALFDLNKPEICLQRGDSWIFGPEASYERNGDVKDVVFPCGQTIADDGDTINLYYGAADSCMALATGSIKALLAWLEVNSSPSQGNTYQRDLVSGR